jgi:hypothetical protein
VTRLLAALALVCAVALGWMAMRQTRSGLLRHSDDCSSSHAGVFRVGGYVDGRGYVPCDNRAAWDSFRGGGPGSGK